MKPLYFEVFSRKVQKEMDYFITISTSIMVTIRIKPLNISVLKIGSPKFLFTQIASAKQNDRKENLFITRYNKNHATRLKSP